MRPPAPGRGSRLAVSPALSRLAYHVLCAGLVPVNDLGIRTQEYHSYSRVSGMVSRNGATNSTPGVSGAKGRSDLVSIQNPRHFGIIDGSIICAKFEPMDWIAILLYFVSLP